MEIKVFCLSLFLSTLMDIGAIISPVYKIQAAKIGLLFLIICIFAACIGVLRNMDEEEMT